VPQTFGTQLVEQLERNLLFGARRLVRQRDAHCLHAPRGASQPRQGSTIRRTQARVELA
jgi:hypothetical protein